jgi:hypothetical protein
MTSADTVETIKSNGHWRISIRPTAFERHRIDELQDCWDHVVGSQVRLSAREYPEIEDGSRSSGDDWVSSTTDYGSHKEYWRFYRSAQFVHLISFWENFVTVPWSSSRYPNGRPEKYLEIETLLFHVTEVMLFAQRLATRDSLLSPAVDVRIELNGTKGRDLVFWHISRFLSGRYTCEDDQLTFEKRVSVDELLSSAEDIALSAAMNFYERFNWHEPPRQVFVEDQRKFLERRL